MTEQLREERLREILEDLVQYLSGAVAPLMVSDSVGLLLRCPPEVTAAQIEAWAAYEARFQKDVSNVELMVRGLEKMVQLGDLGLVSSEHLNEFLIQVREIILERRTPAEREALEGGLEHLARKGVFLAPQVGGPLVSLQPRAGERAPEAGVPADPQRARWLRRFEALVERLRAQPEQGGSAEAGRAGSELRAAAVAAAVEAAATDADLAGLLERVSRAGAGKLGTPEVVAILGRSLRDWFVPPVEGGAPPDWPAAALRRFVVLPESAERRIERFEALVREAIAQFGRGRLARAVTMVEIAAALLSGGEVDATTANLMLGLAHDSFDPERLAATARDPAAHPLLGRILSFFPGLSASALLGALNGEKDRLKRRLQLALIEAHGAAARPLMVERLEASLQDSGMPTAWYYQRNLVYLLHRIPCSPEEVDAREVELVLHFSELAHAVRLVGEALTRLAQIPDPRAERTLALRLRELDRLLDKPEGSIHGTEELERLASLCLAGLVRLGSPTALRAVVDHGLRPNDSGGAFTDRLVELRRADLSGEPELVARLLEALRAQLPGGVRGLVRRSDPETARHLVEALAGTPAPAVKAAFGEIVQRFPGKDFAREASEALAAFAELERRASDAAAGVREGELGSTDLPGLLLDLAADCASGELELRDRNRRVRGELELGAGALVEGRSGRLEGRAALWALLERPFDGSFRFAPRADRSATPRNGGGELAGLVHEGVRRHGELRAARALVPDAAVLRPRDVRPTPPPGEEDGALLRELWNRVRGGATAGECERIIPVDPHRIRSALAHWVSEGALAIDRA